MNLCMDGAIEYLTSECGKEMEKKAWLCIPYSEKVYVLEMKKIESGQPFKIPLTILSP